MRGSFKNILNISLVFGCIILFLRFHRLDLANNSGMGEIFKDKPVITTTIGDAIFEVYYLDKFYPKGAWPLEMLPKDTDGSYKLNKPGYFLFESQSYCLNPGKYSPNDDIGYVSAPLKGPKAYMIKNILKRSLKYPGISQEVIQTLIWAITSKSGINYKSGELYQVAKKLMSPEELREVNKGVFKKIAQRLWERIVDKVPPLVRDILEAQSRIRDMISSAQYTYDDLVSVAVIDGVLPMAKGSRQVPKSRWSFHPSGYFIRLNPRGFSAMLIELFVPGNIQINYDRIGRITCIKDNHGNRIKTQYQDNSKSSRYKKDPDLRMFNFSSIYFSSWDPDYVGEILTREWTDIGWTFFGIPNGNIKQSKKNTRFLKVLLLKKNLNQLLNITVRNDLKNLSIWETKGGKELMALIHYTDALEEVVNQNMEDEDGWEFKHLNLVRGAWAQIMNRIAGIYKGDRQVGYPSIPVPSPGGLPPFSSGGALFDPSGVTGAGGNTAAQSVAASGRGTDDNEECTEELAVKVEEARNEYQACIGQCLGLEDLIFTLCMEGCEVGIKLSLDLIQEEYQACLGND